MKKPIFLILIIIIFLFIINHLSHRHITAVFSDARPFDNSIPVYYKGIKVGNASDRTHSKDSKRTNVKITLTKKLKLPLNTKAILKTRIKNDKEFDYIELIYPEVPSERFIQEHSHIHGHSTVDIKEYLKNQTPEDLDKIKNNLLSASENLDTTLNAIGGLFIMLQDILEENRENIKSSSANFKDTTRNISKATKKIDNIIIEEQWNNTFKNLENSTGGLHNFTHNINNTILDFDKTLPDTMQNTNEITENLNSITCGIKQTLKKNFGGLRLFFGKVIQK